MNLEKVINDLNTAKLILYYNPQMLTPEMCIRIGQVTTSAISLLKEQGEEIDNLKQTAQSMMEGICLMKEYKNEYENGFNDAMLGKQELMYEGIDGKWHRKDW